MIRRALFGGWLGYIARMKRLQLVVLVAVLGGCASAPTTDETADRQVAIDTHALLAEVAFERQQVETAANEFFAAATISDDPSFAERATRLAHQAEINDLGLKAAARWHELAPDDERPLWFSGVFETRANRLDAAVAAFDDFVNRLGDPGSGLALVLEALSAEPYTDEATAIMQALIQKFPGTPSGQYALARLALRSGDFQLALDNAKAAADSDPTWVDAQLLYARSLLVAGRTDHSLEIGARVAGQHADDVDVQLQYAELLLSAGKSSDAETRLNKILDTSPGMPEAIRALAFLEMTQQNLDAAKQHFNDLRGDEHYQAEAFYYLGRIAETEKDYLQATRNYSRVTDGTHAVEAQLRTARILFSELGDRDGAVRHLRKFGECQSTLRIEHARRREPAVAADAAAGRGDEAVRRCARRIAQRPDFACGACPAVRHLGAGRGQSRRTTKRPRSYSTKGSNAMREIRLCAIRRRCCCEEQGRKRKAVDVLQRLVDDSPEDSGAAQRARVLADRSVRPSCRGTRLHSESPRHGSGQPGNHRQHGLGAVQARRIQVALDYLERAYRLEADPEIAAHLVDARWAAGQHDQALELLKTALADHPDDRHLKELSERLGQ